MPFVLPSRPGAGLAAALLVLLLPPAVRAQQPGDIHHRIAAILRSHVDTGGPGALVAIVHRGTPAALHATGLADLDHRIPITAGSRFYLGSLAKQFTTASIALLVADGRLAASDTIGQFVPSLPADIARIPLAHLLHHRSGIRDYLKIRDLNGERDAPFDNAEALAIIRRQRSLVFPPGTRYQYSNSNYILLAEVVAAASGVPLADFARQRIFEPAGMTAAHFQADASAVVPDRVVSYRRDDNGGWHRYVKLFDAVGDGGAFASARDLLRWDAILRSRAVFPASVFDLLLTPPAGAGTPYAGGLLIRPYLGEPAIEHGGFMFGFQHQYLRFPGDDLAILILTNSREIDIGPLREQLVRAAFELVVGRPLPARPATPTAAVPTPPATPPAYAPVQPGIAGRFSNAEIPLTIELTVADGQLYIHPATFRRVPMTRTGATTFSALGGEITVRLGDSPDRWLLGVRDLGEFAFERLAGPRP